jgi:hypothetical protein
MEHGTKIIIIAEKSIASNATNIYVGKVDNAARKFYEGEIVFKPKEEGMRSAPTMSFEYTDDPQLQQLMDSLWNSGIRPTEIGTAGQLAATVAHLKDMQKIAFKFLKLG